MKISCVIATCNRPELLKEQLASLFEQSQLPNEIIICEDLPSAECRNVVLRFSNPKIHLTYIENSKRLGMVKNFDKALSCCTGDLIFLCDDDDIWFDNKIETITNIMRANPNITACYHDVEFYVHGRGPVGRTKFMNYQFLNLPITEFVMGSASCFRRELLNDILPIPDWEKGHDNWVAFVAKCHGDTRHVGQVLQYYRRHDINMSPIPENDANKYNIISWWTRRVHLLTREYRMDRNAKTILMRKRINHMRSKSSSLTNFEKIEARVSNEEQRMDLQESGLLNRWPAIYARIRTGAYKNHKLAAILRDLFTR